VQDGTLLEALQLWKRNIDAEFAGAEPCPICYCVIQPQSYQLPRVQW
jgi:hypothetical protein